MEHCSVNSILEDSYSLTSRKEGGKNGNAIPAETLLCQKTGSAKEPTNYSLTSRKEGGKNGNAIPAETLLCQKTGSAKEPTARRELLGKINNKDEQIQSLHERIMELEEGDRSKQIEFSLLKIERQTTELLQGVKFLPYMQDQVLRQYLHRRYDLSDSELKSMRTILHLPVEDLPPQVKYQDEEEKDEKLEDEAPATAM
ncbi:hypothetical protein OIU76_023911 [Salix suchowensis]|nr:hypothetical protein OIU76_023911 [Salix suchowensis]